MGLCMLIMFPIRGTGGILLDIRNSSLLFGSVFTRTVNPAAWPCTASYTAPTLATSPAPLAEERGEELVLAQPHPSVWSCFTASTLSKPFLDCCICPNSVWIIFGSQDSMDRSAAKPAVLYALSSPALYPVQLSCTAIKSMAPGIDSATPSIHIYVVLSYRLNLFM